MIEFNSSGIIKNSYLVSLHTKPTWNIVGSVSENTPWSSLEVNPEPVPPAVTFYQYAYFWNASIQAYVEVSASADETELKPGLAYWMGTTIIGEVWTDFNRKGCLG